MKKYTHLQLEERVLISHYHDNGRSVGEIAHAVGRSKSTVSRELSRNSNKSGYAPKTAENRYLARRRKPSKIDRDETLESYVVDALHEGLSPEKHGKHDSPCDRSQVLPAHVRP